MNLLNLYSMIPPFWREMNRSCSWLRMCTLGALHSLNILVSGRDKVRLPCSLWRAEFLRKPDSLQEIHRNLDIPCAFWLWSWMKSKPSIDHVKISGTKHQNLIIWDSCCCENDCLNVKSRLCWTNRTPKCSMQHPATGPLLNKELYGWKKLL